MENSANPNNRSMAMGNTFFIAVGWISAIISLIAYPFIFGVLGVVMGILSSKKGSRAGLSLIVGSIVFMGVGLIFSDIIMNHIRRYIGI